MQVLAHPSLGEQSPGKVIRNDADLTDILYPELVFLPFRLVSINWLAFT